MRVQGTLQDVRSRQTAVGPMFDLVVDGTSYGNGKYAPRGIAVGDTVSFGVVVKGNFKNVEPKTLRKEDRDQPAQGPAYNAPTPSPAPTRAAYNDNDRQAIISKQAALNTGIAYVNILLENEAVPLPAKAADRLQYVEALVFDAALRFHKFSTGNDAVIPEDFEYGVAAKKPTAGKKASTEAPVSDEFSDDIPF